VPVLTLAHAAKVVDELADPLTHVRRFGAARMVDKIQAVIREVTGRGFSLHDAISSASLIADTAEGLDGEISLLTTVIDAQIANEMGARGARSKMESIAELAAKIGTYRALLPQHSIDALHRPPEPWWGVWAADGGENGNCPQIPRALA